MDCLKEHLLVAAAAGWKESDQPTQQAVTMKMMITMMMMIMMINDRHRPAFSPSTVLLLLCILYEHRAVGFDYLREKRVI